MRGPGPASRALPGAPLKLLLLETPLGGKVNAAAGKGAVAPLVHRWFRYASQVTYCPAGCIPGKKPLLHRFAMGLTASLELFGHMAARSKTCMCKGALVREKKPSETEKEARVRYLQH